MAVRNFAFSLVQPDPAWPRIQQALAGWATWRHQEQIDNLDVYQRSIDAVQKYMLNKLETEDTIGDVYLYSHGNEGGYFMAPMTDATDGVLVTQDIAESFRKSNGQQVTNLARFALSSSSLRLYGCNLGKKPETAGIFLALFFGGKGRACGTDWWFNLLHIHPPLLNGPVFKGDSQCKAPVLNVSPKTRAELKEKIKEVEAQLESLTCLNTKNKTKSKDGLRKMIRKTYEEPILKVFDEMRKGGQVAWGMRNLNVKRDREEILDGMWQLWDLQRGLMYPFLSKDYLGLFDMPDHLNKVRTNNKSYIAPNDKQWVKHWISRPQKGDCW